MADTQNSEAKKLYNRLNREIKGEVTRRKSEIKRDELNRCIKVLPEEF